MIIPKNILKFWGVFFIILAVALGVITLIYRWHRIFPTHEVSEIYSRYAKEEGIDAAFVKDYRVNDSVTVDVTVLEATTDSAWAVLKREYNIPEPTTEEKTNMEKGSPCIAFCGLHKKDERAKYTNENTLVVAIYNDRTIYVFYSKTKEQKDNLMDMFFEKYFLNI